MTSYPVAPTPPPARPRRVWDLVATIVLLVLLGLLAAMMSFFGAFLAMASDPCGARDCNTELIGLGVLLGIGLPWLVLLVAALVAVLLLVFRRLAFWVPLVAAPVVVASWFIAAAVASAGVPGS